MDVNRVVTRVTIVALATIFLFLFWNSDLDGQQGLITTLAVVVLIMFALIMRAGGKYREVINQALNVRCNIGLIRPRRNSGGDNEQGY